MTRAISWIVSVREPILLHFVYFGGVFLWYRISLAGELFRYDPEQQGSDFRNNKNVVTNQNPVFNLMFGLFYDKVFAKVPGASGFLSPCEDHTLEAILDLKVSSGPQEEFLVSASAVAYLETSIVRAVFSI